MNFLKTTPRQVTKNQAESHAASALAAMAAEQIWSAQEDATLLQNAEDAVSKWWGVAQGLGIEGQFLAKLKLLVG